MNTKTGELQGNSFVPDLEITLLTRLCAAADCPTVYRTNRGTLIVQGYQVPAEEHGMTLPPGELLVEIPAELFAEAARATH